jgi:hypothetical protein
MILTVVITVALILTIIFVVKASKKWAAYPYKTLWPMTIIKKVKTINLYLQTRNNVNIQSRFIKILLLLKPYLTLSGLVSLFCLFLPSRFMITAFTLAEVYFFLNCVNTFVFFRRTLVLLRFFFNQQTIVAVWGSICLRQHSKLLVSELTLLFHVIDWVRYQRPNLAQTLVRVWLLFSFVDGLSCYLVVPH